MLVERLAAWLLDHDPGCRLPRRGDLARRYGVSPDDIDAALATLADRHLVREMADGQVYRASPAEYLITLDRLRFLGSRIDPMGGALTCTARNVLRRAVPEHITRPLRLPSAAPVCAVQSTWAMGSAPAALSTTYLPAQLAAALVYPKESRIGPAAALNSVPPSCGTGPDASPGALCIQVAPPPRWAGRVLRLREGEPVITVTARLDDRAAGAPVALTVALLHPAMFKITVQTQDSLLPGAASVAETEPANPDPSSAGISAAAGPHREGMRP